MTIDFARLVASLAAVGEHGEYAPAAAALGLAESTVRRHVRSLERRMRLGNLTQLTATGRELTDCGRGLVAYHRIKDKVNENLPTP